MNRISPVVKNLLIINILFFLATFICESRFGAGLINPMIRYLALFYPGSVYFEPYQFVTHMFMHGGLMHIFFNMYALWMFGSPIENAWGGKRFLFYYLFTGLGAAALHTLVNHVVFHQVQVDINAFMDAPSPELFKQFLEAHKDGFTTQALGTWYSVYKEWAANPSASGFAQQAVEVMEIMKMNMMSIPTVGASGAIFGILLAFGMMYPNVQLMLLFPPIAIRAKWFVLAYGGIELFLGFSQPGSNIAHFAHVGGMLFGYILIRFWVYQARNKKNRY
ncbi:MAG: rhomboid family intramembrane serine protease [Bacteroidales bacterium]|jgi:membrane associated rhomboid family serine protease|nr:rhomboid family intramembrane serine protease [Bacteroidales bacterium]